MHNLTYIRECAIVFSQMPAHVPPEKELLNVEEFMALYGIGRTTFYSEVKKRKLKIRKLGARTYVLKKDATAWLDTLEEVEIVDRA